MSEPLWYPSVEDVLDIHEDIVAEYSETSSGVRSRGDIEFAIEYVEEGHFSSVPETVHGKAFQLLRLLVANHPFVDGNKRTALNTVSVFYFLNGYRFTYDDRIRKILTDLARDESNVDVATILDYLRTHTHEIDLDEAIDQWRDGLVRYGVDRLSDDREDPNG